jgi:hypothetical protein
MHCGVCLYFYYVYRMNNWVYLVNEGWRQKGWRRWRFALRHEGWLFVSYGKARSDTKQCYCLLPRFLWFGKLDHLNSNSYLEWFPEGRKK